jgi:protein tyrosine/serine phosphatase
LTEACWLDPMVSRRALSSLLCRAGAVIGTAALVVVLSVGGWAGYLMATGNIHTVLPGALFRSAELSRDGFEHVIRHFRINTVINLRGAAPGHRWYEDELEAARATGARHIDLRLSATHILSAAELDEIRIVLARAQRPVLIHCQGGADRSGLVAALYEYWIAHRSAEEAAEQLSFRYGHFPWLGSRSAAMDKVWQSVVGAHSQAF